MTLDAGAELTLVSTDSTKWSSKKKKIAAVDASGLVTALRKCKTTITGKVKKGKTYKIQITVKKLKAALMASVPAEAEAGETVNAEQEPSPASGSTGEPSSAAGMEQAPEPAPELEPILAPAPTDAPPEDGA